MDITVIGDLELAKILSEQQELLGNTINNVNLLKAELKKRLEKQNEVPAIADKPE